MKLFSDVLNNYCGIYRPTVLNTYKIMFMAGNFPKSSNRIALNTLKRLEWQIVQCHKEFVFSTLDMIERGEIDMDYQLEFKERFGNILATIKEIHSNWSLQCSLSS